MSRVGEGGPSLGGTTALVEGGAGGAVPAGEDWTSGRLVLPGGLLAPSGTRHQVVWVRELNGRDEELLSDRRQRGGAGRVAELLARAIQRVEGLDRPVDRDLAADLLIGDRDYLLLRLRQMTIGDDVHQVMRCPAPACGQKVDVEFCIAEIPVRRAESLQREYEVRLSRPAWPGDDRSDCAALRLPTGRDQEAIADLADENPAAANSRLFARLLTRLGRAARPDEEAVRALPMKLRRELADFLRRTVPGPDLRIEARCPHCGADMTYPFDLEDFFLRSA